MSPTDIFEVSRCNRRNLPENYQFVFLLYVVLISPGACFVAETGAGALVGYSIGKPKNELEDSNAEESADKEVCAESLPTGYLISIAVDKPYRGNGVGKLLMSATIHGLCVLLGKKAAKELREPQTALETKNLPDASPATDQNTASRRVRIYLNVRESNTSAIEMYKGVFRFQEILVEKEYYSNKEDALLMGRVFQIWQAEG